MCEGAPNQTLDHKNSTAPGPRPPVLKFLDPPLLVNHAKRNYSRKCTPNITLEIESFCSVNSHYLEHTGPRKRFDISKYLV